MGLSWINPLYFLGLALLALPVLIHLVQRQHPSGFRFPSLMFLERIPWHEKRRLEIRNWLLLLLRCLLLLLIVAAFARPFFSAGEAAAPDPVRSDSVIVIDRSYSMRIADRWRAAQEIARRLVDDKRPQDRIGIIAFDSGPEVVSEPIEDGEELRIALQRLQPGLGITRLRAAVEQADRLLAASTAGRRRILLVSDFQAGPTEIPVIGRDIEVETFAVPTESADNVAIDALEIEAPAGGEDDRFSLAVDISSHAQTALDQRIRVSLDGRALAPREVRLAAGETARVRFDGIPVGAGLLRGMVELESDALAADNRAYFVYSSQQRVPVLIVEESGARANQSLYLEQAMALSRHPLFRVRRATWQDIDPQEISSSAVIIVNDAAIPGAALGDALAEFVAAGGGLLVALGNAAQGNWPSGESGPLPGTLLRRVDAAPGKAAQIGRFADDHPLAAIGGRPVDLAPARVFSYRGLQAGPEERVLARYDDGGIALLERASGDGRVLVLTTTLDPQWNDLVLQPVFVPFLHQALLYLARFEPYPQDFRIGDIVDVFAYARASAGADAVVAGTRSGNLVVEAPSGNDIRLARETAMLAIEEQGFYQVHRATPAGVEVVLAANIDSAESKPLKLDAKRLVEEIRARAMQAVPAAQLTRRRAAELEQRQQIWHLVLAAVLGAMLLEAIYANRISVRRSRRIAV
jgi:hypothetical protein